LNPDDPIDAAVIEFTNGFAFKFTGAFEADKPKPIWDHLELMRQVIDRQPDRVFDAPRATGRVLRDFTMALRAGNAVSADEHLRYLRDHRRITPNNLLFLRIQALAELGNWDDLLTHPELPDLLQMRRPLVVTESVIKAVYRRELERFEKDEDLEGAVAHFKAVVLPSYSALFTRRAGMRAPEALKALMLLAIAGPSEDAELRDTILDATELPESDKRFLKLLGDLLPPTKAARPVLASLDSAIIARDRGDYEAAYGIALKLPGSAKRGRLLIECAYELQTIEAENVALSAIADLVPEAREEALGGRRVRELYEQFTLRSLKPVDPSTSLPNNWTEWIGRVSQDPEWPGALELARRGAREWSIEHLVGNPHALESLSQALESSGGGATLQNALPQLVSFLQTDPLWPRPEFSGLYKTILDLLAIGTAGSEDDVRVYMDIAQAVLQFGVDARTYRSLMSDMHHLLVNFAAPNRVTWGLEALEMTVIYPSPDPESRLQLLVDVVGLMQKFRRRSDEACRTALRLLCHDLDQSELARSMDEPVEGSEVRGVGAPDILAQLNGRSIAIYTLTESAGRYMQQILTERAPQASVKLAHDTVGTDSLKHLAKGADVFIMATASASHAATGFIEAHRPKGLPLLKPRGKGMASMLSALEDFLRQELSELPLELAS
jgi:hypothetical protein